jgi:hypothetical protein
VPNRVVEGFVVAMLNIRKDSILCAWMFGIIHPQDMENHHVDYLCLSNGLWVEGIRFGHLGVHHRPYNGLKGAQEYTISIGDNSLWYPKMNPNMCEEELGGGLDFDALLAGRQNCHLRESINNHEDTIILIDLDYFRHEMRAEI